MTKYGPAYTIFINLVIVDKCCNSSIYVHITTFAMTDVACQTTTLDDDEDTLDALRINPFLVQREKKPEDNEGSSEYWRKDKKPTIVLPGK